MICKDQHSKAELCKHAWCKLLQTRRLPRTSLPAWGSTADLLVMSWGWLNFPPAWNLLISTVKNLKVWLTRPTQDVNYRIKRSLCAEARNAKSFLFFWHLYLLVFAFHSCEPVQRKCKYKDEVKKAGSISSISRGPSEKDLDFACAFYLPCLHWTCKFI